MFQSLMPEEIVIISSEEQILRNTILRGKKRGVQIAFVILILASTGIMYFLQYQEKAAPPVLWTGAAVLTALLLLGVFLYRLYARKIEADMQSQEKIVTTGIVVRRTSNRTAPAQRFVTLDVDGRWLTLSITQLHRAMPETYRANRLYLYDRFRLEFTPFGRHLLRAEPL